MATEPIRPTKLPPITTTTDDESDTTTTEGITREDVQQAMAYLGIVNPKPEIPLETTLTGHQIVAMFRIIEDLEDRLTALEDDPDDPGTTL